MSRFFWVRHGPTHAKAFVGWTDMPADLSDMAQIERLAAYLPEDALVISSDLSRARDTANALAGPRRRLPDAPGLREINFGEWESQHFSNIQDQKHLRAFWEEPGTLRPPGGESWDEMRARINEVVDRLIMECPGRDIIAVAHMGAILTQLQRASGKTAYATLAQKIDNFAITEITCGDAGWQVGVINHLP